MSADDAKIFGAIDEALKAQNGDPTAEFIRRLLHGRLQHVTDENAINPDAPQEEALCKAGLERLRDLSGIVFFSPTVHEHLKARPEYHDTLSCVLKDFSDPAIRTAMGRSAGLSRRQFLRVGAVASIGAGAKKYAEKAGDTLPEFSQQCLQVIQDASIDEKERIRRIHALSQQMLEKHSADSETVGASLAMLAGGLIYALTGPNDATAFVNRLTKHLKPHLDALSKELKSGTWERPDETPDSKVENLSIARDHALHGNLPLGLRLIEKPARRPLKKPVNDHSIDPTLGIIYEHAWRASTEMHAMEVEMLTGHEPWKPRVQQNFPTTHVSGLEDQLAEAVLKRDPGEVKKLLAAGANPLLPGKMSEGWPIVLMAAGIGTGQFHGPSFGGGIRFGERALEVLKSLYLYSKVPVDANLDHHSLTALHLLCQSPENLLPFGSFGAGGSVKQIYQPFLTEAVMGLIDLEADCNQPTSTGNTPLHFACGARWDVAHPGCIRALVQYGDADPHLHDHEGWDAERLALRFDMNDRTHEHDNSRDGTLHKYLADAADQKKAELTATHKNRAAGAGMSY